MDIIIVETGVEESLIITDPKTELCWTNDLMGNYDGLPEYDEETQRYLMTQEDFNWWSDLIDKYQVADDSLYELSQSLPQHRRIEIEEAVQAIDCDLEDLPDALQHVYDDYFFDILKGRLDHGH